MKLNRTFTAFMICFFVISALGAQTDEPANTDSFYSDASFLYEDDDYLFFESAGLIIQVPNFELRSFNNVFPGLPQSERNRVFSANGLRNSFDPDASPSLVPAENSGIDVYSDVIRKNPSHIVEALVVIPYNSKEFDLIDIYNALGRIGNIKDQTLTFRSGDVVHIFTDTTRIDGAQRRRTIPDPGPVNTIPFSETMFIRFTDAYIGDLFLRGDMNVSLYGISYNMTNFRDVNFSIFRIMKSERISINLYIEPVKEGVLVYTMTGFYLPGFILNRMNLTPNINNRITVLLNWIKEGLTIQESAPVQEGTEPLIRGIINNERFNRLLGN